MSSVVQPAMLAYLVIREGTKWTDVFRLIPGQAVTIGRAPTNQIVIKDERCSRCHAEVFHSQGNWILRDLGQPQRHAGRQRAGPRRLRTAARRHRPHRPFPIGLRPRSGQGLSRFQPPCCRTSPIRSNDRDGCSIEPADDSNVLSRQRAGHDHASPRPDAISRAARRSRRRARRFPRSAARRPRFAGWRSSWPRAPDVHAMARRGPGRTVRSERRSMPARCCCCRAIRSGEAAGRRSGDRRLAHRLPNCPITACRIFWPPPCSAKAKPCWPAT